MNTMKIEGLATIICESFGDYSGNNQVRKTIRSKKLTQDEKQNLFDELAEAFNSSEGWTLDNIQILLEELNIPSYTVQNKKFRLL